MSPVVSFIVPAYNAGGTLGRCLESISRQSFNQWEAIIVDDGSRDNSLAIAREWANGDRRFRVITQQNQRQSAARNRAIRLSRGNYIALLDADDASVESRLAVQLRHFEVNEATTVLGGARQNFHWRTGRDLGVIRHPLTHVELCSRIFTECPFSTSTVMARRWFFTRREFDPAMTPCEDHDLWLRSYRDPDVRYANLQSVLVYYSSKVRMRWSHSWRISQMYIRALRAEGRWPGGCWYALRPLLAAVKYNPFNLPG